MYRTQREHQEISESLDEPALRDEGPLENEEMDASMNSYYLIVNSLRLDVYVINKQAYIKLMYSFSDDKSRITNYLDKLVFIYS